MFEPCSAEIGNGSPKPRRCSSSASDAWDGSSILFASSEHVLLRLAQDLRELLVAGRDAGAGVDDEEHEVGLGDRGARLLRDLAGDRMRVDDVDAAGVDQQEVEPVPLRDQLLAVARRALRLVHHRLARRGEPVDQRRLADVREADDRDRALQFDRGLRGLAHTGGVAFSGRPFACRPASQSKSTLMRRSISTVASL